MVEKINYIVLTPQPWSDDTIETFPFASDESCQF